MLKLYGLIIFSACTLILTSCSKDDKTEPAPASNTVIDFDGNSYPTVKIGAQVWMAANLKVTHYRDGTLISNVTDGTQWSNLTNGAYCFYNNNSANDAIYGKLYNWYAVNNSGKLAPAGWHIPTDAEWNVLIDYLSSSMAGGKMKEAGTTYWTAPNTGADNSSGFKGLPGGVRYKCGGANCSVLGGFGTLGTSGYWWSATEASTSTARYYVLNNTLTDVKSLNGEKQMGFSVRCVKD